MGAHSAGSGGGTFDGRAGGPEDLAGIHADDALIDAVHGRRPGDDGSDGDREIGELLAAWRGQVDATPVPELVSLDEAVAAVEAGRRERDRAQGPRSLLRRVPLVAAAALGVIALGLGAGAHQSQPGDPLWPVTEVVFSEHAEQVENATEAETKIDRARTAVDQRDYDQARTLLQEADQNIEGADEGARTDLQTRAREVQASIAPEAPTSSTAPSTTTTTDDPSTTTTAPTPPPSSSSPASPTPSSPTGSTGPTSSTGSTGTSGTGESAEPAGTAGSAGSSPTTPAPLLPLPPLN